MDKKELERILFNDIFDKPVEFNEETRTKNKGKVFPGNARLTKGLYRTDKEKAKYIKETEEQELP